MSTVLACSDTPLLIEWFDEAFHSLEIRKHISYEQHLFFQNVENLRQIPEMEPKIQEKFFVFQIIAFELGVGVSRNIEQDTCHRHSAC